MRPSPVISAALATLAVACASNSDDPGDVGGNDGKADVFDHPDITPTEALNPGLNTGFVAATDQKANNRCVDREYPELKPKVIGSSTRGSFLAGTTISDFDQGTGLSLNLPIKSPLAALNIGGSFAQHVSDNENTIYAYYTIESAFLVGETDDTRQATQSYRLGSNASTLLREIAAAPEGDAAALANPATFFLRQCGTNFVSAVRYGAKYELLIKYKFKDSRSDFTVKASLAADDGFFGKLFNLFQPPPPDCTGPNAAARPECKTPTTIPATKDVLGFFHGKIMSTEGVEVTAYWAATGLDPSIVRISDIAFTNMVQVVSTTPPMTPNNPMNMNNEVIATETIDINNTPMITTKLERVAELVAASVVNDACRLDGNTGCTGTPGRSVQPTGLILGSYDAIASDVETSIGATRFAQLMSSTVGNYVGKHQQLRQDALNTFLQELVPAASALSRGQASYNIAPPGAPVSTPSALQSWVNDSGLALGPEGVSVGLTDNIKACRGELLTKGFGVGGTPAAACASSAGLDELPAIKAANDAIAAYDSKPVVPLDVKVSEETRDLWNAGGICKTIGGNEARIPTAEEAELLKPMLVANNILGGSLWMKDSTCTANTAGIARLVYRPASGAFDRECTAGNNGQLSRVACVPALGPIKK
ncbi:MAG: hypothetical protein AB7R00_21655 [Kofleriaceae bacterium]